MELMLSSRDVNRDVELLVESCLYRQIVINNADLQINTHRIERSADQLWILSVPKSDNIFSLHEKAFMDMSA